MTREPSPLENAALDLEDILSRNVGDDDRPERHIRIVVLDNPQLAERLAKAFANLSEEALSLRADLAINASRQLPPA
jgi:hypothetical protein